MPFAFWIGVLLGAFAVIGLEFAILYLAIERLRCQSKVTNDSDEKRVADVECDQSLSSILSKQGIVWLLEPDKIPKLDSDDTSTKGSKDMNNKKNIVEVCPAKKYARIKDQYLILSDTEGSNRTIDLSDCTIVAVSASDLSTRKWAKRYPVMLESQTSVLYNGNKSCYLYFETSWEKETWCKALHIASCPDKSKLNWFAKLNGEFHTYLMSLSTGYPSFLKPPTVVDGVPDKTSRMDVPSSKVRGFLKKLAKKASKSGNESRFASVTSGVHNERNISDRFRTSYDASSPEDSVKSSLEKASNSSLQEITQTNSPTANQIIPDSVSNEKIGTDDEGTLCWNLIFSRLFFDAKRSTWLNDVIKARIQRTLTNMRTPSYIGGITCIGLNLGDLPPLIHKMRVLPLDLNEVLAFEFDIEYSGGIVLDVETRLDVCDQELQNEGLDRSLANSGFPGGIEDHENKFSSASADRMGNADEGRDIPDELKQSKSTKWSSNYASKWKAAVNSLANKVAQVPLSLAIRIASLQGTLRVHIKPPPSDQLWFGFTSMPDIEWNLDSSFGDQKITSSHVALLIGNRFKASIRETLVLPNCENICIPWMLAEKNDWVPRNVAPFIWINPEAMDMTGLDSTAPRTTDPKPRSQSNSDSITNENVGKFKDAIEQISKPLDTTTNSNDKSITDELREPLLRVDDGESPKTSSSSNENMLLEQLNVVVVHSDDDVKPKKVSGRRAKMMDFSKKMGEKLEEKRRQLEEKSRLVVEKMRENGRT